MDYYALEVLVKDRSIVRKGVNSPPGKENTPVVIFIGRPE